MKSVAVFCGSHPGVRPEYETAARTLGRTLAEQSLTLVYGGGKVGLMGAVADAAMGHGGQVVGVMPKALADREIAHTGLTELHIVPDMATRKAKMAELSDGFIALPGGAGTMEEIFEQWTWAQLGIHRKPVGFLNIAGFYDDLKRFSGHMSDEGFIKPELTNMVIWSADPDEMLAQMREYEAPQPKWTAPNGA